MEIKLNAGDKINIPENCKATIEDNLIIIEEKKEEFKSGDVLHSIHDGTMIIFKAFGKTGEMISYYDNDRLNISERWLITSFRHATEEEKQRLLDALKEQGLQWNAATKTMEKIRLRVKIREPYLIVNRLGEIRSMPEEHTTFDDMNFDSGNYYLPSEREQAEEDAKAVKAIFEKRLKI